MKRIWWSRFSGADQEFLLEHNAELLLALEHVGHRWLRLDPRLHDRVRFDCGEYRALAAGGIETIGARGGAARARNGPGVSI